MKPVTLYQPATVEEALEVLAAEGKSAAVYAGGTDILSRLKNRLLTTPTHLVDIKNIKELKKIDVLEDGSLRIGATCTLTEVSRSEAINAYPLIGETIQQISSPELRNQSTVGGGLTQDVWCPYFRSNYRCWRNGGDQCYAETGDNRYYQSVMGADRSYATFHGDLAISLIALDARVRIASPKGKKEMSIEKLIPGEVMLNGRIQSHVLGPDEFVTDVILPAESRKLAACFRKARIRGVWDFALGSVAVAVKTKDSVIERANVIFGAVGTGPLREKTVEGFLKGKKLNSDLVEQAQAKVLLHPKPLPHNGYKIDIAIGLFSSALGHLSERV